MKEQNYLNNVISTRNNNSIILYIINLIIGVLIIGITNLPSSSAVPIFKVVDTPLGAISFTRITLLMTLLICIMYLLLVGKVPKLSSIDVSMYLLALTVIINYKDVTKLAYFFLVIIGSYFLGKIIVFFRFESYLRKSIIIGGIIQAILVIYSTYVNPIITSAGENWWYAGTNGIEGAISSVRASGTIGHPVVLAAVLMPSVLILLDDILTKKGRIILFLQVPIILTILFAIFLTYSRGTWLSLIGVFIYILYKYGVFKKLKSWVIGTVILIAFSLSPFAADISQRLALTDSGHFSFSHRQYMYGWSFQRVLEDPISFLFGHGIGGSKILLQEYPPPDALLVIDNIYLTFLVEMGVLGLGLLGFTIYKSIKVYSMQKLNGNMWVLFIILGLSLNGITFEIYNWEQIGSLFWILIGMASAKRYCLLHSKY
ncbi:O-antigen ligase family protein [Bacillus taeanensis]|uniref:O-antigen ligase-related domain-containing protein n=1 Tax=Bacillus taeanensis TaxID=273032 RepID=A0A366XTL8_9BACI|nr:O-antigen ligase family protein [Bacillus taeanensis]RBW68888.1 hypothetical protein DS031_14215 [Bacillus taeanensis]